MAAKAALDSMTLAEESAAKTALAAELVAAIAQSEAIEADADVAAADLVEAEAHDMYRQASQRAAEHG
jgi:hypothetical protein